MFVRLYYWFINDICSILSGYSIAPQTTDPESPPCLQYKDVLVLYLGEESKTLGVMDELKRMGISVQSACTDDDFKDLATAKTDVVWVAHGDYVRSLERKVVVCLQEDDANAHRLHVLSRCTSQLIIVSSQKTQQ